MFDLPSFIRQLLPPHRRNPLLIALARTLFGPAQTSMTSLETMRAALFNQVRTTGQVMVLENLLNQLLGTITNSSLYITEGNSINYDFTGRSRPCWTAISWPENAISWLRGCFTTPLIIPSRWPGRLVIPT